MAGQQGAARPDQADTEHLPENVVNLLTAALIWLFGVLVFLPMARRIDPHGLPIILTIILFTAFTVFLIKGLTRYGETIKVFSEPMAREWNRRRGQEATEKTRKRIKTALQTASIIIVYMLYLPILRALHPSINGITLIIAILAILFTIIKR